MNIREQVLSNRNIVKVTSFNLVWGVDHNERYPNQDSFALEYISSIPNSEPQAREQEALAVFELIRPISEQWGFEHASMSAFSSAQRKGKY